MESDLNLSDGVLTCRRVVFAHFILDSSSTPNIKAVIIIKPLPINMLCKRRVQCTQYKCEHSVHVNSFHEKRISPPNVDLSHSRV